MIDKEEIIQNIFNELNENEEVGIPTGVYNSIRDVINEFDDIDDVYLYGLEDLEEFLLDVTLSKEVHLDIVTGQNHGHSYNVYTYYGNIEYSVSERVSIYQKGELIDNIIDIPGGDTSTLFNNKDYVIAVIEKISWENGELINNKTLKIYQGV